MTTPRGPSGPATRRTAAVIPGMRTADTRRGRQAVREPANNDTGAPTPPSELDDSLGNPSDVTPDEIRVDEDAVNVVGSDTAGDTTASPVSLSEGDDDDDKDKDDKKETSHVKYAEGDGDKDKEDADKKDD